MYMWKERGIGLNREVINIRSNSIKNGNMTGRSTHSSMSDHTLKLNKICTESICRSMNRLHVHTLYNEMCTEPNETGDTTNTTVTTSLVQPNAKSYSLTWMRVGQNVNETEQI